MEWLGFGKHLLCMVLNSVKLGAWSYKNKNKLEKPTSSYYILNSDAGGIN